MTDSVQLLIIALGESVLSSGTALADASRTLMTVVTGTCALVTIVALWKLHFASSGRLMDRYVETTTASRTGRPDRHDDRRTVRWSGRAVHVCGFHGEVLQIPLRQELVVGSVSDDGSQR